MPFKVGHSAIGSASAHQPCRENHQRVRAFESARQIVGGVAALFAQLVYRQEHTLELVYGHEQVVDHEFQPRAVE